jgi:tetratricopeptide (TPR) repeat protein
MPEEAPPQGPSDGLTSQERAYASNKDPSFALLTDIKKALKRLNLDTGAFGQLLKSLITNNPYGSYTSPVLCYELPSDLEELYTLRSARFELTLVSGIHETDAGDYITMVLLAVPLMGWEVLRLDEEYLHSSKAPDWSKGWSESDLEAFQYDLDGFSSEEKLQARELVPIMAMTEDNAFENTQGYAKRKQALIEALRILCTQFPFKVHFSESGNIPKEVPDEWISPALLEEYTKSLARLEGQLAKKPDDAYLLYERAGYLMGRDHLKEAEALLDKVITLEPKMPFTWFALSDIYSRTGRDQDADKAEQKGAELEKLLGGRWPGKADVLDFTPPFARVPEEWGGEEARELDLPRCEFCDGDFLHITDGFWYLCNKCNRSGPLEGKGLGLSFTTEKKEFTVGEPLWVTITIENLTDLEMTYSTDDLEFMSLPPIGEVSDDGEEDFERDLVMDWIGKLKGPFANGILAPHAKDTLKIDLRKIETLEPDSEGEAPTEIEGLFEVPGEHQVQLYLKVTAGPIENGKEPWSETDPIRLIIKKK